MDAFKLHDLKIGAFAHFERSDEIPDPERACSIDRCKPERTNGRDPIDGPLYFRQLRCKTHLSPRIQVVVARCTVRPERHADPCAIEGFERRDP